MKKLLLFIFLIIISGHITVCKATHIFGGELLYTHIAGNTYRLTLTLYSDCQAPKASDMPFAEPKVDIYDDQAYQQTISLAVDPTSGNEVSPICPPEIGQSYCNGGTLPGARKYIYNGIITLPNTSKNWRFDFNGDLTPAGGQQHQAGRSSNITNLGGTPGTSVVYLEATLNNINGPNSSPQYTTIPTPFYCNYTQQQYNPGAIDPDNDSLGFALVPGLLDNINVVSYVPPYSATAPLATSNFNFTPLNGQLSFTSNLTQDALVVNKVEEYKNGVLIGSSMREMTFIIFSTCHNRPPAGNLSGISLEGVQYAGNNIINVCYGTPAVSFQFPAVDSDFIDTITVTANNVPQGAVLKITDNKTPNPVIDFSWNTTNVPPGVYNMYINYKDNGCPLSSNQTIAYTIQILRLNEAIYTSLHPNDCYHREYGRLKLNYGTTPRTVTVTRGGFTKTYTDSTGTILDSFYKGDYAVHITSAGFPCPSDYVFSVVDSGIFYPPFVKDMDVCLHDSPIAIIVVPSQDAKIKWYSTEGDSLPVTPSYTTSSPGINTWFVTQKYKVCESEKKPFHVTVHDLPHPVIQNKRERICLGDNIRLMATGGVKNYWQPDELVTKDKDSLSAYSKVAVPTTFTVTVVDSFNCKDTASITFDDIEPCCLFSYPSAFTPNGDGVNDGFRVLLYGNEASYNFFIYDRWGRCIFHTTDPKQYWDGTYMGKDCEVGTYFYRVNGKCLTGHIEEQKGDLTLIR